MLFSMTDVYSMVVPLSEPPFQTPANIFQSQ
jgi:hypothetical protein